MTEDHIIREVEQEYDDSETTEVTLPPCLEPHEAASIDIGCISPQVLVDEVVEPQDPVGSCTSTVR